MHRVLLEATLQCNGMQYQPFEFFKARELEMHFPFLFKLLALVQIMGLQGLLEVPLIANNTQREWQVIPQISCGGNKAGIAKLFIGLRYIHGTGNNDNNNNFYLSRVNIDNLYKTSCTVLFTMALQ